MLMRNDIEPPRRRFYVYTHARPDGSIFYVGKGNERRPTDFHNRGATHKSIVQSCGGPAQVLVAAYEMYDERHAFAIEIQMIALLRKAGVGLCNKVAGGRGTAGLVPTPEHRERLRAALMGHPVSEETRRKMSIGLSGRKLSAKEVERLKSRKLSDSHKAALRMAITGRVVSDESRDKARQKMLGRVLSEEHRRKLSEVHAGRKQPPELVAKRAAAVRAVFAARRAAREAS